MTTKITPLRANAIMFCKNAGFSLSEIKMRIAENRKAKQPAWDVFVKIGGKRGVKVGTMLANACDPCVIMGVQYDYS